MRRALALAAAIMALLASTASSNELPSLPHRFHGSVTINGRVPADGTRITAYVGNVECGRTEIIAGSYRLDVTAATARASCGVANRPVRFMVGYAPAAQAAAWEGARFTELHLSAHAAPFQAAALDLESPCIPAYGRTGCESARMRLWQGESEAWRLLFDALGALAPSPDRVFEETLQLRLAAGDPAIMGWLATSLGWPYVRVTGLLFRGALPAEPDEFVEITNLGGGAQDMTGWRLRSLTSGAEFRFRPGWALTPGARCRIYTAKTAPESCPGYGFGATFGLWDDDAGAAVLTVDFPAIVADVASYRAAPEAQPPAPALRGVVPAQ